MDKKPKAGNERTILKKIIRLVGILLVIEFALFIAIISTSMTDEQPPAISRVFYWTLKYVFGTPMVFWNKEYPYFLDSNTTPIGSILILSLLNNIILASGILCIINLFSMIVSPRKSGYD